MSDFITLVKYELKKIFTRKTALISVIVMMLVMAFMVCADVIITDENGKSAYDEMEEYRMRSIHLNGRRIDDRLLCEMRESFESRALALDGTINSDAILEDITNPYRPIYVLVKSITGSETDVLAVDETALYKEWRAVNEKRWENSYLTEGEKNYWREKMNEVETPFTYYYSYGSSKAMEIFYTCSVLMLLMVTVSLSAVFSDEYGKGMDRLIMVTRKGRDLTYFAKLVAGVIFAFVSALLIILSGLLPLFACYGTEGINGAVQLYMETSPFPMTIKEVILVYMLIYMISSVLYAVLTMLLSQVFKSSITAMGIMTGFLLVMMCLNVPERYRCLACLFDLLPANVLAVWSLYDCKLVPFWGGYLTNYMAAVLLYVTAVIIMFVLGRCIWQKRADVRVR